MPIHSRQLAATVVAIVATLVAPRPIKAGTALVPSFDYSLPPRFVVPTPPGPGNPAPEADHYFNGPVLPESWTIELDACDSLGAIANYAWHVDGEPTISSDTCDKTTVSVPTEGEYNIRLVVTDASGKIEADHSKIVSVQDWLVIGLGDSYGSGEGAPDVPVGDADILALDAARKALESAEATIDSITLDWVDAGEVLDALRSDLQEIRNSETAWQAARDEVDDACDNFPPTLGACLDAQANLVDAGADLLSALADIDLEHLFENSTLLSEIDALEASAEQALVDAEQALVSATAARDAAAAAFDDLADSFGPTWQSRQCHRSSFAGQVQAARFLEDADPRTSVTFIHVACSGARIPRGLIGPFSGQEPVDDASTPGGKALIRPQVDIAAERTAGREIDAAIVSIGGNDVQFGGLLEACAMQQTCFESPPVADPFIDSHIADVCAPTGVLDFICYDYLADMDVPSRSANEILTGTGEACGGAAGDDPDTHGLDDLSCNYDDVQTRINELTSAGSLFGIHETDGSERVYLTAYPSFTRRESSPPGGPTELCAFDPSAPLSERARNLPGFSLEENDWVDSIAAPRLAEAMQSSAIEHGWRFVDEHVAEFVGHGYCADDNWIVRLNESVEVQARLDPIASSFVGAAHPNAAGHAAYAEAIVGALLCDFYDQCDPRSKPRTSTEADAPQRSGACGDADANGTISAADALRVLRRSIDLGVPSDCELCRCDVDSGGSVTATDALVVLRKAVGVDVPLNCSVC